MANTIKDIISNSGLERSGIYVFSKGKSLELIAACEREKVDILGIDAFIIIGNTTQPSLENSIDFTALGRNYKGTYEEAKNFLNNQPDELYFEVITES